MVLEFNKRNLPETNKQKYLISKSFITTTRVNKKLEKQVKTRLGL